jgi:phage-related holin
MSNPILHQVHHYLFGLSRYLHEVMVEYRVVSCIGQIIIDTDIALFSYR